MKLHNYSLQPTTGLKPPLQILSGSVQKGKDVLKFPKLQKPLQNCLFFSNAKGSLEFPASTKQTPRKRLPVSVLKLLEIL